MGIRTVTYFQVVCDAPQCGSTTFSIQGSVLSPAAAWETPRDAVVDWMEHGGLATDLGHYCPKHAFYGKDDE